MPEALARIANAAEVADRALPRPIAELLARTQPDDDARAVARSLRDAPDSVVILGDIAIRHPQASWLRCLARAVATATGSAYNELPTGANAVGLARVGAQSADPNHRARAILESPSKTLITWQSEAEDSNTPAAWNQACENADFYVHAGAYTNDYIDHAADAVLPLGLPPETDGTWVNVDGLVQPAPAGAALPGAARPGWKVLRALGAALGIPGFDFVALENLCASIDSRINAPTPAAATGRVAPAATPSARTVRLATVGIYRTDAVVRRAKALQAHPLNATPSLHLDADDVHALGLAGAAEADVNGVRLPVVVDPAVPSGCAWIEAGHALTATLPSHGAPLRIQPALA
jgi:NADH-quinone oxidoreductase subunit G